MEIFYVLVQDPHKTKHQTQLDPQNLTTEEARWIVVRPIFAASRGGLPLVFQHRDPSWTRQATDVTLARAFRETRAPREGERFVHVFTEPFHVYSYVFGDVVHVFSGFLHLFCHFVI